jgi:heme-degrading monooxygenase HmoA
VERRDRQRALSNIVGGWNTMIARISRAQTTSTQARAYTEHLKNAVLPAVRKVKGYEGAMLLQRQTGDDVELIVITWWNSLEAISGFAGDDIERAVVADEAADLLTQFDDRVLHYDLMVEDEPK